VEIEKHQKSYIGFVFKWLIEKKWKEIGEESSFWANVDTAVN
jgi:hypothetical protein